MSASSMSVEPYFDDGQVTLFCAPCLEVLQRKGARIDG